MANPEHVEIVKQGAEAIRKWREENPNVILDLSWANLATADLTTADLHETILLKADLREATLRVADLRRANLDEATLVKADLHGANLGEATLIKADLGEADLPMANLSRAILIGASLARTNLFRATLSDADLRRANLAGARLVETDLARANLDEVRGAHHARGLETVRLREGDAQYFERCHRPWPERKLDWERLRVVGRLPLFGVSYTALILIPIVFYGLDLYNDKVKLIHAWAEQVIALPDHPWRQLAWLVLERLHPRPIPSQSLLLLISTSLLAAGSTLYTFFSPSRIKEFSRDQWCDQIGRSLLHYWPLAWRHRSIRLACTACYALGGLGAAWVLANKIWRTAVIIWENSPWPWPWW